MYDIFLMVRLEIVLAGKVDEAIPHEYNRDLRRTFMSTEEMLECKEETLNLSVGYLNAQEC